MGEGTVKWFNGVKGFGFIVTDDKPVPVRVEYTPLPGISAPATPSTACAIDANRPSASPLLLTIGEVHPHVWAAAADKIDVRVDQCLTTLLTEFSQTPPAGLAQLDS